MPLPDPPFFEVLLFERPWPAIVALTAIAITLWVVERRPRAIKTLGRVAAPGGGRRAGPERRLVETSRETLAAETRRLVQLTLPLDIEDLGDLLDPSATLTGPGGDPWLKRDEILRELSASADRWPLIEHRVRQIRAEDRGPHHGRTSLILRTTVRSSAGHEFPVRTRWLIRWQQLKAGRWRVVEIRWLKFQNGEPTRGIWR